MSEPSPAGAFVLDVSVALAWCFRDESSPETAALLRRLATDRALVPPLWGYEVANMLGLARRRSRLDEASLAEALALLDGLPIEIDPDSADAALRSTLALAVSAGLPAYDAAYLELARRRSVPLATRDAELRRAAVRLGIALL
ncbi:MAG: type II toxin-antitoxin system VapC family toxin [Steroidobacteraceae bacterium]|jgi:predicted nucleic acid-binding protein|nr:type II toxin-antitoxin system VapC family toxin [Steroidobacteraceae bacterium]